MTEEKDNKKSKLTLKSGKLGLGKKLGLKNADEIQVKSRVSSKSNSSKNVTVVSRKKFSPKKEAESHEVTIEESSSNSKLTQDEQAQRRKVLENAAKEKEAQLKLKAEQEALEAEKAAKAAKEASLAEKESPSDQAIKEEKPKQDKTQEKAKEKTKEKTFKNPEKEKNDEEVDSEKFNKVVKRSKEEIKKSSSRSSKRELQDLKNSLSGSNEEPETITERVRSLASIRRAKEKAKKRQFEGAREYEKIIREVILPDVITVTELANRMAERTTLVVRELMKLGVIANGSQPIDSDTAELVIDALGHKFKRVKDTEIEDILEKMDEVEDDSVKLVTRAPVVTIMGHVDHGKTSLLDAFRSSQVASGEAGGITQHIGAYQVRFGKDKEVTFLDTPGHEAFTAMRSRGADITDIVIIVVAADDGIMAQTIEAINHAKAAGVPIIVAINKIDKPSADPTRVKTELMRYDLIPEDMGGDIMCVEVSAKERINLEGLIDGILLQTEMMELKANPERKAIGIVVEAKIDKNVGPLSTVLVQKGSLKIGDIVIAGTTYGKVRALKDDHGRKTEMAGPSEPVELLGLAGTPDAGDKFYVVDSEREASKITDFRIIKEKELKDAKNRKSGSFEDLLKQSSSAVKELFLVIKADVQGSLEAIVTSLEKLSTDEVKVKIIHAAVGAVNESDVSLADVSGAMILAFNVRSSTEAQKFIEKEKIIIRYYSIIYNLIDDVRAALSGMLSPSIREEFTGTVEIRQVFNITKSGKVGGAYVTSGFVKKDSNVRLLRDNVVIHEGKLKTLKRFKDDVKEVKSGYECGVAFEKYEDIRVGDVVEVFETIEEKREL